MEHSIAAKYAARPAARSSDPRLAPGRRLGLRVTGTFRASEGRATVLRRADLGPLVRMRASWRAMPRRSAALHERPTAAAGHDALASLRAPGAARRSSAGSAPWHA